MDNELPAEQSKPMELPAEWVNKIKVDAIKYESATQHEGLGPALYYEGAIAYAPWLYTCQMNYAALQAKVDRYEAALKIIQKWQLPATGQFWDNEQTQPMSYEAAYGSNGVRDFMRNLANEAISAGDGEKEPEEGKIIVCNNSDAFRYWTANIKGYRIAHKGLKTVVWLPEGMTSEILAKEWNEYENANNLKNQKEDKQ
jgi:hypothetical protein